ncbi:hypothetical protein FRACYDRAFT_250580 [Fragilariopsis cylindrus CCMP1102]|uniref:Uncharacterized protein n=1 Tax=Fragilariopsis cylindrus CCMP1102 TaxID=635003 RepID=A0A1E7EPT2_9STRA|nr:hypothetical protein FRACYDRAFT_250580 [Fragilariopsis cylindrus CCMP1102]|eukprot:OEU07941.1 hypothetical protein FRACYDRAFT_250580 [Fragilariopsis cylindrus CCMP1102]
MSQEIYSTGAYISVDPSPSSQGCVGFVTAVYTEEKLMSIENSIGIVNFSPFIDEGRLHAQSFDLLEGGGDGFTTRSGCCRCFEFGIVTKEYLPSIGGPHPVLKHLKEGKDKKEAGWMRQEAKKALKLPSTPTTDATLTASRKERTDVGKSVFTLVELSVQDQIPYRQGPESLQNWVATASEDSKPVLLKTNGAVTWREISSQLARVEVSIAAPNTIHTYVMALPESEYETIRMRPMLNAQHQMRRNKWARMFDILWHGDKIPSFGCFPVDHKVHHKSHIDKFMVFAMSAFVPNDNNWMKGGELLHESFKVILQRIGGSCSQLYRDGEESTEPCGVEVIESLNEVGGLDSLRNDTLDVMAEFKRDGELLPEHEYNPQKLL